MRSDTTRNRNLSKLWFLLAFLPVIALIFAGAYPNVPLYVRWDGTIAAPTQFLNATFKSGANITLTDNGSNLTIAASAGTGSNSVVIIPGTNIVVTTNITGTNITYTVSTAGSFTNQVYYSSLVQTSIAYSSTITIDGSYAQNVYHMTNAMTGHMWVILTNLVAPQCITLIVPGAVGTYTNWNIFVSNDWSSQFRWLSLTNGYPSTTITSNQFIQFDFLAVTGSTNTNVMAAWKETAR